MGGSRVWIAVVLLVAGCSRLGPALPTLEAAAPGVEETCPEELFGPATLEERLSTPDSPVFAVPSEGPPVELVWAGGYVAEFSPLVIRDRSGSVVAEDGDRVWLTGGGTSDDRFYVCGVSQTPP